MSAPSTSPAREAILELIGQRLDGTGLHLGDLDESFDLLGEGAIDSFGFLELITALEERFSIELDFEDVDTDQLSLFGPFCKYVESHFADGGTASIVEPAPPVAAPQEPPAPPTLPEIRGPGRGRRPVGRAAAGAYRGGVRVRDKVFSLLVSGSFASFGRRTVLQRPIRLVGEGRIAIGSDGFVGANSWLQVLDGAGDGVAIEIGDGVSIAGLCVLSSVGSIRIGRDVSIARNVYVADHAHVYDDPSRPVLAQGVTESRPVEIGDGAWLGENVVVLPGVRIGKGAVVSANSVVSRDIPEHSVAAGSPARVLRRFGSGAERAAG